MSVRNGFLGFAAVIAAAGGAAAQPPINPLVEGREPNPVVRDFHQTEPPTFGYGGGAAAGAGSTHALPGAGWWTARIVWEVMLDRMTMPLGTVPMGVWD